MQLVGREMEFQVASHLKCKRMYKKVWLIHYH